MDDPAPLELDRLCVVVPHEATGGVVSFVEQSMRPRALISGHVHERNDVWIRVIDGLVGVRVGDRQAVGEAGDYLLKPRGVPHAMWNPSDEPNRLVEILTPGDADLFFREIVEGPDELSPAEFAALSARHHIRWFDDWTDELRERHGLR